MLSAPCSRELHDEWFPHTTDSGLNRIIQLLESGSPLLIHGAFTRAMPMGCLATHIAWHHPDTEEMSLDAGIAWLSRVAGLNPATSHVIRAWDCGGPHDWDLRSGLLTACLEERQRRQTKFPKCDAAERSDLELAIS
jgi:hypothetical protein